MYEQTRIRDDAQKTEPAVRQPQVLELLDQLESVIASNEELAANFEKRLAQAGILRTEPGNAEATESEPKTLVPVASRVRDSVLRLQRLSHAYGSLLRRLEI